MDWIKAEGLEQKINNEYGNTTGILFAEVLQSVSPCGNSVLLGKGYYNRCARLQ